MRRNRGRKILKILALGLGVFFLFWLLVPPSQAVTLPPPTGTNVQADSYFKAIGKWATQVPMGIIAALLAIIEFVLRQLLYYLGVGLDNVLRWNIEIAPAAWNVVQLGWTTLRDMANAFFILIVLWIAFTIIFGFDRLGGKRLLVRVILMALLINFSLVLVATVFGFANVMANVFYQKFPAQETTLADGTKLKQPAVSQYIKNALQVDTLFTPPDPQKAQAAALAQQRAGERQVALRGESAKFAYAQALGVEQAQGVFFIPFLVVLGVSASASALWSLGAGIGILPSDIHTLAMQLAMIDIFLFIAVAIYAVIIVMLIARIVAELFLSIISPAAFFLYVIPGGYGEAYFKKWLTALLRWAFFAPAFFFLFYLSLYILGDGYQQLLEASGGNQINAAASLPHFLTYLLSLGFMLASVIIARKIAGSSADVVMNLGKKAAGLGMAAATGGLGLAAGMAARYAAPAAAKIESSGQFERASRYLPFSGTIRKGLQRTAAAERQAVAKSRGELKSLSSAELQRRYPDITLNTTQKAAILETLAERGDIAAEPGVTRWGNAQVREGIGYIKRMGGDVMPILRAAPEQIDAELLNRYPDIIPENKLTSKIAEAGAEGRTIDRLMALREIAIEKAKPDDVAKWSSALLTPDNMHAMWRSMTPDRMRNLMRNNRAAGNRLITELRANPNMDISPEAYRFLGSNQARGLGLALPEGHKPPAEVMHEEIERQRKEAGEILAEEERTAEKAAQKAEQETRKYEEAAERRVGTLQDMEDRLKILRERADKLTGAGSIKEAEKLRDIDIKELEAKVKRAREELQ